MYPETGIAVRQGRYRICADGVVGHKPLHTGETGASGQRYSDKDDCKGRWLG
jgi:hypothetical protein